MRRRVEFLLVLHTHYIAYWEIRIGRVRLGRELEDRESAARVPDGVVLFFWVSMADGGTIVPRGWRLGFEVGKDDDADGAAGARDVFLDVVLQRG